MPIPPPPPPPGGVIVGGLSLTAQVQRKLRGLGYYEGSVDGEIGPITRGAIRAFQRDVGMPVSGRIDAPLLRALGL